MFDKSTRFKQVCQLLLSLIVGIKMRQLFQSYSLLLRGNFIGGEMTVNELHSIANPNRASVKHSA